MKKKISKLTAALGILALAFSACTALDGPTAPNEHLREATALRLGAITVAANAPVTKAASADFAVGQSIIVTATPTATGTKRTATYIYNDVAEWAPNGEPIYYNDVFEGYGFSAAIGTSALVTNQATAAAFLSADYIAGPLSLDATPGAPMLVTGDTPLEHQNVQIQVALTRGIGWTDNTWAKAVSEFNFTYLTTTSGTTVEPYVDTQNLRFSARMPFANTPRPGGADLFSIILDGKTKTASYTLTGAATLAAGMSLQLSAKVHAAGELSLITATLTGWEDADPMEFKTSDIYNIYDADKLFELARRVNGGKSFKGETITLHNDLDLEGAEWTPIGTVDKPFAGIFNGNGKSISNFKVTEVIYESSLFGSIAEGAKVEHLTVKDANISTDQFGGAIVGINTGTIEGCVAFNSKIGGIYAGGIAGTNAGTIAACLFDGELVDSNTVGGIAGYNSESIVASISMASKVVGDIPGTIVGHNNALITSCRWKTITGGPSKAYGNGSDSVDTSSFDDYPSATDIAALNTALDDTTCPYRWSLDGSGNPIIVKP